MCLEYEEAPSVGPLLRPPVLALLTTRRRPVVGRAMAPCRALEGREGTLLALALPAMLNTPSADDHICGPPPPTIDPPPPLEPNGNAPPPPPLAREKGWSNEPRRIVMRVQECFPISMSEPKESRIRKNTQRRILRRTMRAE